MATTSFQEVKAQVLTLVRQRKYEEALQILESASTPNRAHQLELLELRAMCYFHTKRFNEAAASYLQLAEEDPGSSKPYTNLGAVYNRMQRFDEAASVLQKALKKDKNNLDAYFNLGYAHRHAGQPKMAVNAYKEALRLNPQLDQAHLNLANAYADLENYTLAITHYRTALTINPNLETAERGLKKTQERQAQSQQDNYNPFGRLVDVTRLSHKKAATAMKMLTEAERKQDRDEVQRLTKGIRNAARHVSEEMREKLEPALLALTRAVIDGENHPEAIPENYDRFKAQLLKFEEGHRYLKRSVLELRGHEEVMNTPEL